MGYRNKAIGMMRSVVKWLVFSICHFFQILPGTTFSKLFYSTLLTGQSLDIVY